MRLSRAMLDALLPPGSLWAPQEGGGLDALLDGVADCLEPARESMHLLARVRNPKFTALLSDLEREYGVIPNGGADDETRRTRLAAAKAAGKGDGSLDFLQSRLDAAGFDVQVHVNNPPVDPAFFALYDPTTLFGSNGAAFGASSFGAQRGQLLVNGTNTVYAVPVDPGYWPLCFFVAGDVTRNGAGEITDMVDAEVQASRKAELATLILKCKPMHTWAGLRILYV